MPLSGQGERPGPSADGGEPDGCGDVGRFPPFDGAKSEAPIPIRATPFVWRDPRTVPPRRWLYGRHYIRRYPTATIAPGGLGKTSLALVEALAMVTGKALLGVAVPQPLRVWYWNGEDPLEEVERRVLAACLHHGIAPEDIGDRLFLDSGRDTPIVIAARLGDGVTIMRPVVEAVTREVRERRIDLLIIDPFVSCHAVPENDNGAIDKITKTWGGVGEAGSCGVELVHHVRNEDASGAQVLPKALEKAGVAPVLPGPSARDLREMDEMTRR